MGVPCQGDAHEKECGGVGRMLAYAFTCDAAQAEVVAQQEEFHNPSTSYSMRIDLVGV